jgi:hypothetical protein
MKNFYHKFTHSFRKLDLFTTQRKILSTLMKWSSLQKSASKFTPIRFYAIDSLIQKLFANFKRIVHRSSFSGACTFKLFNLKIQLNYYKLVHLSLTVIFTLV